MGDRYAGIGRHGHGRRDTRHHLEGDVAGEQRFCFFTAPSEDEGVAALEAHHQLVLPRLIYQKLIDFILFQRVPGAGLAHVDALG